MATLLTSVSRCRCRSYSGKMAILIRAVRTAKTRTHHRVMLLPILFYFMSVSNLSKQPIFLALFKGCCKLFTSVRSNTHLLLHHPTGQHLQINDMSSQLPRQVWSEYTLKLIVSFLWGREHIRCWKILVKPTLKFDSWNPTLFLPQDSSLSSSPRAERAFITPHNVTYHPFSL